MNDLDLTGQPAPRSAAEIAGELAAILDTGDALSHADLELAAELATELGDAEARQRQTDDLRAMLREAQGRLAGRTDIGRVA